MRLNRVPNWILLQSKSILHPGKEEWHIITKVWLVTLMKVVSPAVTTQKKQTTVTWMEMQNFVCHLSLKNFSSYVYRVGFLATHVDKPPSKSCAVTWLWRYNLHQCHQPNLCNYVPLLFPRMKNAFTLQKNSVWNPVQSHVKLLACVHLQLITLERAV